MVEEAFSKNERLRQEPIDIVADALMIGFYRAIRPKLDNIHPPRKGVTKLYSMKLQLREATKSECGTASVAAIYFMHEKYAGHFNRMMIVKGIGTKWDQHYYFLVRDIDGVWYAGSPANYDPTSNRNRLTAIISSNELTEVIEGIRSSEGGQWPSAQSIEECEYFEPSFDIEKKIYIVIASVNASGRDLVQFDEIDLPEGLLE